MRQAAGGGSDGGENLLLKLAAAILQVNEKGSWVLHKVYAAPRVDEARYSPAEC